MARPGTALVHEHRHHRHPHVGRRLRSLRRSPDNRVLGGVCGAVSRHRDRRHLGPGRLRPARIVSGGMVLVYAVAWMMIPMEGETTIFSRAVKDRRGSASVVAVLIPLLIAVQSRARCTSPWSGSSAGRPSSPSASSSSSGATPTIGEAVHRPRGRSRCSAPTSTGGPPPAHHPDRGRRHHRRAARPAGRGHTTAAALKPVGGAALLIAAAVIVFGPWWLSLVRDLIAERQARALPRTGPRWRRTCTTRCCRPWRSSSVRPTTRRTWCGWPGPKPRAAGVALRGASPGRHQRGRDELAEGVNLLQRQVEADHGITVQVVVVGDCELDDPLRALLDAAPRPRSTRPSGREPTRSPSSPRWSRTRSALRARPWPGVRPRRGAGGPPGIAQSIRARVARFGG